MVATPFLWGRNGQRLTQSDIENQRAVANALIRSGTDMSPFAGNGWVGALGKGAQAALGAFEGRDLDAKAAANLKATSDADNSFYSSLAGTLGGDTSGALPTPGAVGEVAATDPGSAAPVDLSGGDKQAFIGNILPLAIEQGQRTGVDPRIIVAQAAQESGWGAHAPGNNYFGIKSHGQDGGNTLATTEYVNGSPTQTSDSFRGYGSLADSVKGYGDFILKNPRYSGLRTAQGLDGQLAALGASGYATDPHYASSVGAIARAIQLPDGTAPVIPVQTASLGPVTPQDATAALAPAGPYVDPQVTTASQTPNPAVAQALLAPPQDTTSSAMPVSDALRGGRVGGPAITQQNFDDRMGGAAPPSAVAPLDPSTVQDYGTQAPQAAPQQQAPITLPQPVRPAIPPLNPAVIRALQDPNASAQTKQVAASLLTQYGTQRKAYEEQGLKQQQEQQALAQRQAVAQQLGINPLLAADNDAWKQALAAQSTGGGIINAGDGRLYNSRTGTWINAPDADKPKFRQATADEVKQFGTNGQVGPDGKFYPVTPPQGTSLSVDPTTGAVSFNQGAGVKPLTEGQGKDAFFVTRMTGAAPTLDASEQVLTSLGEKSADALPGGLGNYMQSEEYQLAKGAGKDFVTAFLRKDSGAAISKEEESTYGNLLLPQPGDAPGVIAAKRQRRQVAVEAIKAGLPPAGIAASLRAIQAVPGADKANTPASSDLPPVPDGVEPEVWKFMTPEQRKLWQ